MLVIDESFDMWNSGKNPYDYHLYFKDWWKKDIESMMLRDRNHASIIMWSIGNEVPEQASSKGAQTAKILAAYVKSLDSTRPVTAAVNRLNPDKDSFFATLDVSGYNYAVEGGHKKGGIYESDHERMPGRIIFGSESYPLEAFDSWMAVEDHPYIIGDFVWTAFDYIGEASIGWLGYPQAANFYPWNLAFCGDIDICGWKRPQSYYRDALWKKISYPCL
ncbi:MAG: glycoside hydrolase family 2 TIM barrel-domain containing protein [Chitinophagaceae bacterium]